MKTGKLPAAASPTGSSPCRPRRIGWSLACRVQKAPSIDPTSATLTAGLGFEARTDATVRLVGRRARHQSWEHHSVELQARVTVRKRRRAVLGHRRDGVGPPLENAEHDARGRLNWGCPRSTVHARLSVRCEQVPWYVQGWVPIDD